MAGTARTAGTSAIATTATANQLQAAVSDVLGMKPLLDAITQQDMITVKIGPKKKQYRIHKGLITHHSEYFGNAVNGAWKEADENDVALDEIEPPIFDVFVQWLYTQTMPSIKEIEQILKTYPDKEDDRDPTITVLTKCLVFGDRFLSPAFRRAANRDIVEALADDKPGAFNIFVAAKFAFDNLPEEHMINELFIDLYCEHLYLTSATEDALTAQLLRKNLPYKFLLKVIARYSTGHTEVPTVWEERLLNRCEYYMTYDNVRCKTVEK